MPTIDCKQHGYFDSREIQIDECPVCLKYKSDTQQITIQELQKMVDHHRTNAEKLQETLDIITTPNVSYFDMTPSEEIARLEALLEAAPLRAYNWAHQSWGTPAFCLADCRLAVLNLK